MQRSLRKIALVLALASTSAAVAQTSQPIAMTQTGAVRGAVYDGVSAFLGIPYAAAPTGTRRWQGPAPVPAWTGTRDAKAFGPACPQVLNPPEGRQPWTPEYLIPGPMSEDCLSLNVWRPSASAKAGGKLPVLFWIHGGGGVEGSSSVPVYDGAGLARQGIVVVSINYRLGILASLVHPGLVQEQGGTAGNYGFQDAVAALRWVRANIAAFGGDPARVTIAGQSAGAGMVSQLIGSPAAHGLFARAITESGSQWGTRAAAPSVAQAAKQGEGFGTAIGAPTLAALRAMPADALVQQAARQPMRFGNVIDGKFITHDAFQAQDQINDTPILSGFNTEEESGMDPRYGQWSAAELAQKRASLFGAEAGAAEKLYPAASDAQAREVGQVMARERSQMAMYEWARHRAVVSHQPIYLYFFGHPHPGPLAARYGTFHSSEIPYVFDTLTPSRPFTAADRAISKAMQARWVAFVKGGAPDVAGQADWPAFTPGKPEMMQLGDHVGPVPILTPQKRAFADDTLGKAGEAGRVVP